MLEIKEYVKAESLEQAFELNQKRTNQIIGGMLWMKMGDRNIQKAIDKGAILVSDDGTMTVNVLVQADAIQAEGFTDAKAAFAAFDAQA